ncbi:unnamed protein product [Linum tenue]|uniref:Leucine-rich repeat-containing N-terminal plant-type domain-containing protein n=1 Tax=Linum tenue TaxID=586396 RepID=A0AAV0LHG8_9ROSI|nr:unnamed protein product [Linum tenue]
MTIVAAFLFCMCFCLVVSCEGCSLDERETFLKFKGDLEDPSSFLSSWVGQKDCCTWFGVVCDKFTDHVTELHLGWPSSWHDSMFSDLARNSINRAIPTNFGALAQLHYVDISQNSLHGVVYPDIHFANLKKLACFYASGNHMVLKVKPDWDPSKLLQVLDLESCFDCLEGCVANLSSLATPNNDTSDISWPFGGLGKSYLDTQILVRKGQLLDCSTILNNVVRPNRDAISRINGSINEPAIQINPFKPRKSHILQLLELVVHNLGGKIPSRTQLLSFDSFSFTGNQQLCRPPLNADCSNDSSRVLGLMDGEGNDEEHELHWFSGSIALDFVGGFCSVVALFAFNRP